MKTNTFILFTVLLLLIGSFTACSDDILSFTEYSLDTTLDQWDLDYKGTGNVVLVNSDEELAKYFLGSEYPVIDFSIQSLLLVSGTATNVIAQKAITNFRKTSKGKYELDIEIQLTFLMALERWVIPLVVDKIPDNSSIKVNVKN